MADQEDEDLQMALRMSMQQHSPPEPKRSRPRDEAAASVLSPEDNRRLQRELMAAAAEKRMVAMRSATGSAPPASALTPPPTPALPVPLALNDNKSQGLMKTDRGMKRELSIEEACELFSMIFGHDVSKGILAQWTNQGIRFSLDPETSMGLVQHEGGPCGVLAAVQAFVLKYLTFFPDELKKALPSMSQIFGPRGSSTMHLQGSESFSTLSEDIKLRALIRSMGEILFTCGSGKRVIIATVDVYGNNVDEMEKGLDDETVGKALEGLSIESASDLLKILRVEMYNEQLPVYERLQAVLPIFRSRLGAMLFLISALLSRGLDAVQADRDDPSLPLVTAPFGHASQEIVNLLLCGEAVANVFDGRMDLGGGMSLKGISCTVEVGFLTLLESLNFCKVGQHLKCPRWPIWVVGSESHYTVLFSLHTSVQEENELEERESQIRRAFDAQDQSGGGGFISIEGFQQVLMDANIRIPREKVDNLCGSGYIVWSEFWQVILDLDKSSGGLKDNSGLMGKKVFDLYHFNGIAKSDLNGQLAPGASETPPVQRPRLTKLKVSVPPRWTPEEFMADVASSSGNENDGKDTQTIKPKPPQHAPVVDCIRTRWPRAVCNWVGDPPSIV